MTSPALILVRHSLPEMIKEQPANRWRLSAVGRQRCAQLAQQLAPYNPQVLLASHEPKAMETAQIVGLHLGLTTAEHHGLQEHDRSNVGWMSSPRAFRQAVIQTLERPHELVFGRESGQQARERFAAAVTGILNDHPDQTVMIVSHGTVITLFVSHVTGIEPVGFWQGLGLPAFVVLSRPGLELQQVVNM